MTKFETTKQLGLIDRVVETAASLTAKETGKIGE